MALFTCVFLLLMATLLLAFPDGCGVCGIPRMPGRDRQASRLFQRAAGLLGGDGHLCAQFTVVIYPLSIPAVQADASSRAGIPQVVILAHL